MDQTSNITIKESEAVKIYDTIYVANLRKLRLGIVWNKYTVALKSRSSSFGGAWSATDRICTYRRIKENSVLLNVTLLALRPQFLLLGHPIFGSSSLSRHSWSYPPTCGCENIQLKEVVVLSNVSELWIICLVINLYRTDSFVELQLTAVNLLGDFSEISKTLRDSDFDLRSLELPHRWQELLLYGIFLLCSLIVDRKYWEHYLWKCLVKIQDWSKSKLSKLWIIAHTKWILNRNA